MQKKSSTKGSRPKLRPPTVSDSSGDIEMQGKKRMMEFKARQKASDAAIGHLTRIAPPSGEKTNMTFKAFDYLGIALDVWMLVAAGADIDVRWNETWDLWRINIGTVAGFRILYIAMIIVSIACNWWNERILQDMLAAESGDAILGDKGTETYNSAVKALQDRINSPEPDDVKVNLLWNTPVTRLGFTYNAVIATGWILNFTYLYMELATGNGIARVTFNDLRTARVFVHVALLLALNDFVISMVDLKQIVHAGMKAGEKDKHACVALKLAHDEAMEDYPDIDLVMAFVEPVFLATSCAATGLGTLLVVQVVIGPSAFWSIHTVRLVAGVAAALCAGFVLLHFIAYYLARPHKCAGRVMRDSIMYWLYFMVGYGIVWIYTFEVTSDALLSQQSLETYIWWLVTFTSQHAFFVHFTEIRSYVSVIWQMVYCPNMYGL